MQTYESTPRAMDQIRDCILQSSRYLGVRTLTKYLVERIRDVYIVSDPRLRKPVYRLGYDEDRQGFCVIPTRALRWATGSDELIGVNVELFDRGARFGFAKSQCRWAKIYLGITLPIGKAASSRTGLSGPSTSGSSSTEPRPFEEYLSKSHRVRDCILRSSRDKGNAALKGRIDDGLRVFAVPYDRWRKIYRLDHGEEGFCTNSEDLGWTFREVTDKNFKVFDKGASFGFPRQGTWAVKLYVEVDRPDNLKTQRWVLNGTE